MRYKGKKDKCWSLVKKITRKLYKHCYTCPAKDLQGANAHSGHYQPVGLVGSNNRWSWDLRFIRLQCGGCNGVGQGRQVEFRRKLVAEYGEDLVAKFDKSVMKKEVLPVDFDVLYEELVEVDNSLDID